VVTAKTDDTQVPKELMAAAAPGAQEEAGSWLAGEELEAIVDAAIGRLTEAYALEAGQVAILDAVSFEVTDLSALVLGQATRA